VVQGGGALRCGKKTGRLVSVLFLLTILWTLGGQGCIRAPVKLIPPDEIQNLNGQASFYVRSPEKEGRLRLGFYLNLPDKVKLELFNPLGGIESILWLSGPEAILYLPGEKVFWQGQSQVITSDFFGTELKASELIRILGARWPELKTEDGWMLLADEEGSVMAGERRDLRFEIKERFAPGQIPRTIYFEAGGYEVRMRILKMKFNRLRAESVFAVNLPPIARELQWEEISVRWNK
jgi:hypothetical protein